MRYLFLNDHGCVVVGVLVLHPFSLSFKRLHTVPLDGVNCKPRQIQMARKVTFFFKIFLMIALTICVLDTLEETFKWRNRTHRHPQSSSTWFTECVCEAIHEYVDAPLYKGRKKSARDVDLIRFQLHRAWNGKDGLCKKEKKIGVSRFFSWISSIRHARSIRLWIFNDQQ